ncbi:MAG TPA: transporter [Thermoanaerobaculia bacterium]|nr:transporter [Thermoanaerobaculia bacterium]
MTLDSRPARAGPITFLTGLPVAERQGVLRIQYVRIRATEDPTSLGRELTVEAVPIVLATGITPRLAAFVAVPLIDKSFEQGGIVRGASGTGDTLVFARYTAFSRDEAGATLRVAPFAGVEVPTGAHNERDSSGRLPQPLQPGSGSWDFLGGIVFTRQTLQWELDADAGYRRNGEGDRYRFGEELFADVSLQYRVLPRRLSDESQRFVYAVVESNLARRSKDEIDGRPDVLSGGTTMFIDFGIQYVTESWILEAALRKPVVQNLAGGALERDYEITAGFRFNFSWLSASDPGAM